MADNNTSTTLLGEAEIREKTIIKTSVLGIVANIFLAAFKAFVGLTANSVAVISDAVNNISDALSSVITIIGTKLAGRAPDKKHPMGHGRAEYITAFIVSAIVLYAGITTVVDSVKKIIHPEEVNYSTISLVILAAAVVVKLVLGTYTKKKGKSVNSGSLIASGQDAFQDAILSLSVLASAAIYIIWGIKLEAWVGAIIGLFIIKAGIEMILEAVGEILGMRADSELTKDLKERIGRDEAVQGVYDLFINNFGPDKNVASVHVEVDENMTAREIDAMSRRIQYGIYEDTGVILQAIGVYSVNNGNDEAAMIRHDIRNKVMSHEGVLQIHGFYLDTDTKTITFDVILDFEVKDRHALYDEIVKEIRTAYPNYRVLVALDTDVSD